MALPRLLAYLDARVVARNDLGVRLAAVAAVGPTVALVARGAEESADHLARLASRCVANARPAGARVYVTGRIDVALATGAHGVIRRQQDLSIAAMRQAEAGSTIRPGLDHIASVHSAEEAWLAVESGAAALVVGTIWRSRSHPERTGAGIRLIKECVATGLPVFAIGGVTPELARQARGAGAWGVAAIGALWDGPDSYRAALDLLGSDD